MSVEPRMALHFDARVIAPLIRLIVAEALDQLEASRRQIPEDGKLAFSEEEAARMLGLEPHVLRDERRRGRIRASQVVGRRIRYQRDDLLRYLADRRIGNGD